MHKPRFTPGSYHVENGTQIYSEEHGMVASAWIRHDGAEDANAQLLATAPDLYEDEEKKLAYLKILKGNILSIGNELSSGKGTLDIEMTLKYANASIDIIIRETEELLAQARGETGQRLGGAK